MVKYWPCTFRYRNNSVVFDLFEFEFDEDILGNLQRRLRESFLIIWMNCFKAFNFSIIIDSYWVYLNCYLNIRMVIPHKLHCGFLNLTGQTHLVTLTQPIVYSCGKTKNINILSLSIPLSLSFSLLSTLSISLSLSNGISSGTH